MKATLLRSDFGPRNGNFWQLIATVSQVSFKGQIELFIELSQIVKSEKQTSKFPE